MIKEVVYCDRCGKECEKFKLRSFLIYRDRYTILTSGTDEKIDLCQKCCDEFVKWLKNGRE